MQAKIEVILKRYSHGGREQLIPILQEVQAADGYLTAVTSLTGMRFTQGAGNAGAWVKADVVMDKPVRGDQLINEVRSLLAK